MTNNTQFNLKTLIIALTVAGTCVMTSMAVAQERGKPKGPAADGHRGHAQFVRLDTSGDGFLQFDEMLLPALNKAETKFNRKDVDQDGFLTFTEASNGREPRDLSAIAAEIVQCVADLKADTGNELIVVPDANQFTSPEQKFANVDTSGDELLELAEVQAAVESKIVKAFSAMESDGDGQISLAEFKAIKQIRHATHRAIKTCVDEIQADD
jgi:hypothetical protein